MTAAARTLSSKGRQTRLALEDAARTLFAQRGFHGTTLADITSAAGRSTAAFYRYFTDKEDLLAVLAEEFLRESVEFPMLPDGSHDGDFFTSAVSVYWDMIKPNIGIMVAVDQLAATEPRFALLQNRFRRFGIDIVGASVRRAQQQGYAGDLDVDHIALAVALLFERFTSVSLAYGLSDDAAVRTLSTIWRKTVYGPPKGAHAAISELGFQDELTLAAATPAGELDGRTADLPVSAACDDRHAVGGVASRIPTQ